jgi:FlaA1/EpsC-like NDP-sugar epimerase
LKPRRLNLKAEVHGEALTLSSILFALTVLAFVDPNFPWPIFPIDWGVCLLFVGGARLVFRALWEARLRDRLGGERRTLIVGAGDAGEMLIREIGRNPGLNFAIVGLVDDDRRKQGRRLHGIKVLGGIDQLPDLCRTRRVEELLIAIPSATGTEVRRIIRACRAAKVRFSTIPSLVELKEAPFTLSKVRRVKIEDLLRRDPVSIERAEVEHAAPLLWGQV